MCGWHLILLTPVLSRGELVGYATEGGGLTYLIVRNAGHMVPISQPRWAREIVYQFTHEEGCSLMTYRFIYFCSYRTQSQVFLPKS
jgi:hypothetical protein